MSGPLNRLEILASKLAPPRAVPIPEWGGRVVHVRVMTGQQRERWERMHEARDRTDIRASMLVWSLSDEAGNLIFTDADIPAINQLEARVLMRLYDVALEVNKVSAEEIEELAGN